LTIYNLRSYNKKHKLNKWIESEFTWVSNFDFKVNRYNSKN